MSVAPTLPRGAITGHLTGTSCGRVLPSGSSSPRAVADNPSNNWTLCVSATAGSPALPEYRAGRRSVGDARGQACEERQFCSSSYSRDGQEMPGYGRGGSSGGEPCIDGEAKIMSRIRSRALLAAGLTSLLTSVAIAGTTAATTPSPTTNALVPSDSSPDMLPATTTDSAPVTTSPPPGQEITVTADLVEFGDGLVGLISNMARADGRTYVIAGRYQTEGDLLRAPEEAVLAAFDDVGRELWRTELDGRPTRVVVLNGDLWVYREEAAALTRIDSSDGRVLGDVTIDQYVMDMVAAFESLWVLINDSDANPIQLMRIGPDLSTTTVELPPDGTRGLDDPIPVGVAAGAGAIWVPMRAGGVAVIDPDTLEFTVMPVDDIGHEVQQVAVDGDVAGV